MVLLVNKNSVNYIPKQKQYLQKTWKRDYLYFPKKYKDTLYTARILVPSSWNIFIFAPKKLSQNSFPFLFKLVSKQYYFHFSCCFTIGHVSVCPNTQVITIATFSQADMLTIWRNTLNYLLFLFTSFFFHKIKFKGKGYYIYKNWRSTIAPQFGYYHRIYIYSFFNKVKFLSKTKVLLFGLVKTDVLKTAFELKSKRPINIFTGRGVRFARQIIYKKTGKVSSYR